MRWFLTYQDKHAFFLREREIRGSHLFDRAARVRLLLMDFDAGLKVAIGWNRWNMKLIGIWPEPGRTDERLSNFKALLHLSIITIFGTGPQSANLFFIWGDLELVTENLSTANIPGINAMIKLIFVWYYRDSFKPIVKSFSDDWRSVKAEEERAAMLKVAKSANFISVWCSVLTLTMVTAYLSLRSVTIYLSDRLHLNQDRLSLYPGYFPYNIRPVPILLTTNFAQIIAAYSATICYTTVDTFIAMLVLHICGQFEILRKKLSRLMDGEEGNRSIDEFQKELVWIITKHEHLNWFAEKIEKSFSTLMLLQMLLCTIEICFQGFLFFNVLIKNENGIFNFQLVFFVLFVGFILVHVYLYCYIGEVLLVQSREMSNCAYESSWYNVSPSETKCLLFIMNRSTRPLCLTAGKFGIFSMELFSTILKTAMGYLSVLLTVADND